MHNAESGELEWVQVECRTTDIDEEGESSEESEGDGEVSEGGEESEGDSEQSEGGEESEDGEGSEIESEEESEGDGEESEGEEGTEGNGEESDNSSGDDSETNTPHCSEVVIEGLTTFTLPEGEVGEIVTAKCFGGLFEGKHPCYSFPLYIVALS